MNDSTEHSASTAWDHGDEPAQCIPSTSLLRQWARDSDNSICWGLDALANEIDRLRHAAGESLARNPIDAEFIAVRARRAAREDARLDAEDALPPPKRSHPAPLTYRAPIESVCAHGKTLGPCPHCSRIDVQEQRDARSWTTK